MSTINHRFLESRFYACLMLCFQCLPAVTQEIIVDWKYEWIALYVTYKITLNSMTRKYPIRVQKSLFHRKIRKKGKREIFEKSLVKRVRNFIFLNLDRRTEWVTGSWYSWWWWRWGGQRQWQANTATFNDLSASFWRLAKVWENKLFCLGVGFLSASQKQFKEHHLASLGFLCYYYSNEDLSSRFCPSKETAWGTSIDEVRWTGFVHTRR